MTEQLKNKLAILADAAKYDVSCSSSGSVAKNKVEGGLGSTQASGICHSYTPDGRCISLLKILFTNNCIYDCSYCVNRVSNDVKRTAFTVDEVVWLTIEFYRRNYIEGLFLSSGIVGTSDETMEKLNEVARKLRIEERFNGYIHLKGVAGASPALLAAAGQWADRVSANVELPAQSSLDQFAPGKSMAVVNESFASLSTKIREKKDRSHTGKTDKRIRVSGQSTQLVVGPGDHTDRQIMRYASQAYTVHKLNRVYYSAYTPIPGADKRLPVKQVPLQRENRLYQADWLVRLYGFDHEELTDAKNENLALDKDPKLAWALRNLNLFPIDVNKATREELLRVPGLGFKSVDKVLAARQFRNLSTDNLKKLAHRWKVVRYFVLTSDFNRDAGKWHLMDEAKPRYQQPSLFQDSVSDGH